MMGLSLKTFSILSLLSLWPSWALAGPSALDADAADATTPVEVEPVEAEPVEAESVEAETVEAEPVEAEPGEAEPVEAEPVEAEPVEVEPLETAPVEVIPGDVTEPGPKAKPEPNNKKSSEGETRVVRVRTGGRGGFTATTRTIGGATISTTPKRSAEDLLRLVPGMFIVQHGNQGKGHQIFLRGFDAVHGSDVAVSVDGIPLNEASNIHGHGYLDLSFLIPEVVSSVQARKGSFGLDQGNFATAGSIGYTLGVTGPERGTRVLYEAGTTNRHRAVLVHAPRDRSEHTFLAVEALHDSGYGENRKAQRVSSLGQARLWQGQGAYVDALGSIYAARFGLPGTLRLDDYNSGRVGFYDAYVDDTSGQSAHALGALKFGVDRTRGKLRATAFVKGRRLTLDENFTGDLVFSGPGEYGDRHLQQQDAIGGGVQTQGELEVHTKVKLLLSAGWQGDIIDQHQDQLTADRQIWDVTRDQLIRQHHLGLAPGVQVRATPWLRLEGGLRLDLFHYRVEDRLQAEQTFTGTRLAVSPRLAVQAAAGRRTQVFAAYGRGLRSPEARALTLPEGPRENEDLNRFEGGQATVTIADNAEVGARVQPNSFIDIGAALYGVWIARESLFDHVSGFNIELGPTRRLGVEADIQIHPTDWLEVGADLTLTQARFTQTGLPVPGAPPVMASMFATLAHPKGWRAGLRGMVLGRRALAYGATAGALGTIDMSFGYRFRWFQVDLAVDNVIGLRWKEGEYHFASHWDQDEPLSQIPTTHFVAGPPLMARLLLSAWF